MPAARDDDGPGLEILLAEDSGVVREHLGRLLESAPGVTAVVTAASLEEARELLNRRSFDMWVLDFQLGDGTALELMRSRPRSAEPIPVVLVTSHVSGRIRELCLEAGADVFLDKWEAAGRLPTLVERLRPPPDDCEEDDPGPALRVD